MTSHSRAFAINPSATDQDLLKLLLGRKLSAQVKTLCLIGAHRFEEKAGIEWIFPSLENIYLFEPLEGPRSALEKIAKEDPRVRVFPFAISETDGTAEFQVANNDGESSSLLKFGTHTDLFPHVAIERTIQVETRKLSTVIEANQLHHPDLLIVDVQGAEYQVLASLEDHLLQDIRMIYTEVSKEPVYLGSRTFADVEALLTTRFANMGYAPLTRRTPMHGNAVFVRHADVDLALQYTLKGHGRNLLARLH